MVEGNAQYSSSGQRWAEVGSAVQREGKSIYNMLQANQSIKGRNEWVPHAPDHNADIRGPTCRR